MAVLKDLIVHGPSRFLNGINTESMEANTIKASTGIFNQLIATTLEAKNAHIDELTANNATVFGVMDVKGKLQTNQWEAASIANVGGNFYISPTGKSSTGTVTITRTSAATSSAAAKYSVAMAGTFGVSSTSSTIWAAGAYGMATGNVSVGTKKYPLGTCDGPLSGISNNSPSTPPAITGFTISNVESAALDIIFDENPSLISNNAISGKPGSDLQVSVYLGKSGDNYMPIGILLTSYGKDNKQYIDIYDGAHNAGTSITGFADPVVRIGDLSGISPYTQSGGKYTITPQGWGIYTTQGYFRGEVYSEIGYIGGWTIDGSSIKTNNKASISDNTSGMRIDSANGIGFSGVTYFNKDGTGKVGPWSLSTTYLRNGNITGASNTSVAGVYLGTDGLNISGGSAATTAYIYKNGSNISVNIGNKLTWNGSTLSVTGDITATSGTIGGCSISNGVLQIANANITGGITIGKLDTSTQDKINTALSRSVEYIVGTQTGTTNKWTGVTTDSSIYAGKTIAYYLPYAGTSSAATLNLTLSNGTTTGEKNVRINNSNVTTHYSQYSVINLTYDGTYWKADNYNSDSYDNRVNYFGGMTSASKGIWAGGFFMEDGDGTFQSICTASDGTITSSNRTTATTKKANTSGFKIGSSIWYTNTSYDANTKISGNAVVFCNTSCIDSRYGFNTMTGTTAANTTGLTVYKPIYLVGSINNTDGLFYLDETWYTQTPNNSSKVYILFGAVFDVTGSGSSYYYRVVLYERNNWYKYDGSKLVDYAEYASKTATNYITDIDTQKGITIKPSDSSGNDYLQMDSSAISFYRNDVETVKLEDSAFRIGKLGTNMRNVYVTDEAVQIRNNTTVLAEYGSAIKLYSGSTPVVTIDSNGGSFSGEIIANTGQIGGSSGWTIASRQISRGTLGSDNSMFLSAKDLSGTVAGKTLPITGSTDAWRFTVGSNFGITNTGGLYASEAVISGAITASSGYIGTSAAGFTIGASSFYNPSAKSTFNSDTVDGVYIGTTGIALGKGAFKVTSSGALTTSNLQITSGNSYLAGNSTNNVNAFYWGTPTNFNVAYKGKYFINTSGNACFNSLYIGGHTVGDNWVTPTYYFTNAGNIKANSVTTNTISGTPVISGFYLHSNKDRGVYVTSDGYVSVYNNENRVQLSAGSGSNTYRIYAYCSSFYVNSTLVSSSDKKIKNHISYLANDEKIEDFIMSLKPVSYTLKNGQSGRKHLGFYAQDVRDGAKKTIGDAAIYLASTLDMDDFENYNDDIPDEEISWGLRYDEFIAPLVALVQKQNREIKDLQNRIAYLEKSNDL